MKWREKNLKDRERHRSRNRKRQREIDTERPKEQATSERLEIIREKGSERNGEIDVEK